MKRQPVRCSTPALLTGTSTEYLGRKPWPKVIRERRIVFVMGPEAVGKTSVAQRIAGDRAVVLDTRELQHAVLDRVRQGEWAPILRESRALVLDGPVWLRNRPGLVDMLAELLRARAVARLRTVICQSDNDGSIETLIRAMEAGSIVVVGLRFPKGKRGRLRHARRLCDVLEIPREAARGTELLEPWRYDVVGDFLAAWPASAREEDPARHFAGRVPDPG